MIRQLADEAETLEFGRQLYGVLAAGMTIFLRGNLGAGKTTLVRGCLRAAGFHGPVKSPTFTVVEEYPLETFGIVHFDLYRLTAPEELEWLGIRDYLRDDTVCFIEWPERAEGMLPDPDLDFTLMHRGFSRVATVAAAGAAGQMALTRLGHPRGS